MASEALYLLFIAFIIGAYFYYRKQHTEKMRFYRRRRNEYLEEHSDLSEEKREALTDGRPWSGMSTELLTHLFGEPNRKRALSGEAANSIWNYGHIFVLVEGDSVKTWRER